LLVLQRQHTQMNIKEYIVNYNVFENIGYASGYGWSYAIVLNPGTNGNGDWLMDSIYIYNNVIYGNTSANSGSGIFFLVDGEATNIHFKNNIIVNFDIAPMYCILCAGQLGTFYSQYNIFYSNERRKRV